MYNKSVGAYFEGAAANSGNIAGGKSEVLSFMDGGDIGLLIALIVLVALSSFFSATETAYTSFSTVRMRRMAQKKRSARVVLRLGEDYNKVLTTLLIGNNIVNIAAATISTILFGRWISDPELAPTLSTIVLTVVILIFGEITPKTLAREAAERFACLVAYPLLVLTWICWPLNFVFGYWKKFIFLVFGLNKKRKKYTEEEFKMLVSDVREEGVLNDTEHELINRTLRYDELHVGSCMIPLERVILAEVRDNSNLIYKIFRETNFSRIPVYKGTKQNIIGLLYRADFYENLLAGRRDFQNIIRPVSYTTTDEKVSDLMKRMQAMREQMVIVGAEGNALGLITREDMLEELLGGDIDDKYDLTPITSPLQPFIPEPEKPETVDETEE